MNYAFFTSTLLIIAGFIVPPTGIIDGSVLTAVGRRLLFTVVEKMPEAIKAGRNIKFQKGDMSIDVSSTEEE